MMSEDVTKLETRYAKHGVRGIESKAKGLQYIIDDEKKGIIIAGTYGMTLLSIKQAQALQKEIGGILEDLSYYA